MRLNSFQLKCIAILTMLVDHIGAILFPEQLIFRYIGRIAFPIFCFLLVEGFFHTRNIEKYMIRLGIFALVSEIPYDLAFRNVLLETEHQNVFFSLLLGVMLMHILEKCSSILIKATWIWLFAWSATVISSDYGYKAIVLIVIYYYLRSNIEAKAVIGAGWNFFWGNTIQFYGALATIPICMYNGEKGKSMKYFFYAFYPAHLLVLYVISRLNF